MLHEKPLDRHALPLDDFCPRDDESHSLEERSTQHTRLGV